MKKKLSNVRYLTELALLVAVELVIKMTGLSNIPLGPFNMNPSVIVIAVGAMLMDPMGGGIIGGVYGLTSFYDAVTGRSAMTGAFFQLYPLHTFILCVVMRVLVGVLIGYLFRGLRKIDKTHTAVYFICGLCTALLNTILFMGYIVLVFYHSEYVQGVVEKLGATGPMTFVLLSVGVQGLVEAALGAVVGGGIAKGVAKALKQE